MKKVLIANRGEIARRVIRTLKKMNIASVAIYSDADKNAPHVLEADEAVYVGASPSSESYLKQDLILQYCKDLGVDAIHPGYGFLSENAGFARKVKEAGMKLIGPSPESMELMGDKLSAKQAVKSYNVPLVPGVDSAITDINEAIKVAEEVGYPILIKASAGGGGKGMRIVEHEKEFISNLEGAKREALNAFSDDTVLIEKYIKSPRHIEIQVMSDSHGNHLHLFERECSIQRRYQKIVEESPSTAVNGELRKQMTDAALKITRGINYLGAGTVELILDKDGKFYFLEMNTRLQVEHPVTEMVTGLDLVRLQILVASGEKLPMSQAEVNQTGHAIEVRLYAEDPDNNFLPSIGTISKIGTTHLRHVRLDSGYVDGNDVSIAFDPMLAKLIAFGETRDEAIKTMDLALNDIVFLGKGIKTNRSYLKRILKTEEFKKGLTYTHFVNTYKEKLQPVSATNTELALAIAAFLFSKAGKVHRSDLKDVWSRLEGFRNV